MYDTRKQMARHGPHGALSSKRCGTRKLQTERASVDVVGSVGYYEHPAARHFAARTRAVTFKIGTNGMTSSNVIGSVRVKLDTSSTIDGAISVLFCINVFAMVLFRLSFNDLTLDEIEGCRQLKVVCHLLHSTHFAISTQSLSFCNVGCSASVSHLAGNVLVKTGDDNMASFLSMALRLDLDCIPAHAGVLTALSAVFCCPTHFLSALL
ncbi:hypothetical protein J6590_040202 [Homalodisca vitripennis]|nr:hypothetical protein J6590_040202 [Homalodisca vitripennis]